MKMKINRDQDSVCDECRNIWKNTPEMYDLLLCGSKITLCKRCLDNLFQKTLKASCAYNAKVKSQEDMQRIRNYEKLMEGKVK